MNACVNLDYDDMDQSQRDEIIHRLKSIVARYEDRVKNGPKAVCNSEKCCCCRRNSYEYENPEDFRQTVTIDGRLGKPIRIKGSQKPLTWKPPSQRVRQPMHRNMHCYCSSQIFPNNHSTDGYNDMECCCGMTNFAGPHQHFAKHHGKIDEAVWDYCTSGIDSFPCPPGKKGHKHWTPHVGTCHWPNPCPADCFDHSDIRDWIDNVPKISREDQMKNPEFIKYLKNK